MQGTRFKSGTSGVLLIAFLLEIPDMKVAKTAARFLALAVPGSYLHNGRNYYGSNRCLIEVFLFASILAELFFLLFPQIASRVIDGSAR